MTFLIILFTAFLAMWALPTRYSGRSLLPAMRRSMGLAFIVAGISHFATPDLFRAHFPDWVPARDALVYGSGVVEVIGGLALFSRRRLAEIGTAIAAYLLLVFPANVYVAVADVDVPGLATGGWYLWVRLPLQGLFIWWALHSTTSYVSDQLRAGALGTAHATN